MTKGEEWKSGQGAGILPGEAQDMDLEAGEQQCTLPGAPPRGSPLTVG